MQRRLKTTLGSSTNIFLEKNLPCCSIKTVCNINDSGSGQSKDTLKQSGYHIKSKHSLNISINKQWNAWYILKAVLPHGSRRLRLRRHSGCSLNHPSNHWIAPLGEMPCPKGHLAMSGDILGCHNCKVLPASSWWVQLRDDAKHPTVHRMVPPYSTKNCPPPHVGSRHWHSLFQGR